MIQGTGTNLIFSSFIRCIQLALKSNLTMKFCVFIPFLVYCCALGHHVMLYLGSWAKVKHGVYFQYIWHKNYFISRRMQLSQIKKKKKKVDSVAIGQTIKYVTSNKKKLFQENVHCHTGN